MRKLKNEYECKKDWPEDCFVQGDNTGIVIGGEEGTRKTAFFEAFPAEPNSTFIRGEGKTLEEAEEEAFKELTKYLSCPGHEFERKDSTGRGKCSHCGIEVSDVFESTDTCDVCGAGDAGLRSCPKSYCASCYFTDSKMGAYHDARLADVSPEMEPLSDEDWSRIAFDMLSTRTYFMLHKKGMLAGLNSRKTVDLVRDYRLRSNVSSPERIKDIALKYMLNAPNAGEKFARFFTEGKASRMLACPDLNDKLANYHYDIKVLMDSGVDIQKAYDDNHMTFVAIATEFAQEVLNEGANAHVSGNVPEDAVRARTKEERDASIGNAIEAIFGALANGGGEEELSSEKEDS